MNIEPTETEINRGIAEWMGWTEIQKVPFTTDKPLHVHYEVQQGWSPKDAKGMSEFVAIPCFTTSHDACHEALERMTEEQFCEWHEVLLDLVGVKDESDEDQSVLLVRRVMAATAHQKALAIYRVIKGGHQ